jgi:polysaccharide biosynthesis protein PslG
MRQMGGGHFRPPMMRIVCVGVATVAVSAVGATVLLPGSPTGSMNVAMMAAIDQSNTTIGIADSDLVFDTPAQMDAALDQMQAMGVNTVRIGIPWAGVEPIPGYYNWSNDDALISAANARGMGVLAVLTTTPSWATAPNNPGVYAPPASAAAFGQFAGLVAQRYGTEVSAYEIWNEPNAAEYYSPAPDPAGYTKLLQAAYPAIKAANPSATVIGGVVGSTVTYQNLTLNPVTFVQDMYADGAQGYFDALSFHPYQYTTPFSQGAYNPNNPIVQLSDIHNLMVANGDGSKLIWASEYGEPSSVAGEANQAAYLQDMLTTWRTISYTGPAFVYTLQDTAAAGTANATPEDSLGVIRNDGTWKPAAYVIQALEAENAQAAESPLVANMALVKPEAALATPAADPPAVPQTPMGAVQMVAASVASLAGTVMQDATAMVANAIPQPRTAPVAAAIPVAPSSPTAIPVTAKRPDVRSVADTRDAPKKAPDTQKKRSDDSTKHSADGPNQSRHSAS